MLFKSPIIIYVLFVDVFIINSLRNVRMKHCVRVLKCLKLSDRNWIGCREINYIPPRETLYDQSKSERIPKLGRTHLSQEKNTIDHFRRSTTTI